MTDPATTAPADERNSTDSANSPADGDSVTTLTTEAAQKRISELEAQVKDKEGRYVYLYAEFENYKKRMIKERSDLIKFGWESVARDLLEVIDNLERALAHMPATTDKTLSEGLKMVFRQFRATLEKQGVQAVATLKHAFNPELHEAVSTEDSEHPAGTVVQEHTAGYTLHGRLLRPARVVVSSGNQTAT